MSFLAASRICSTSYAAPVEATLKTAILVEVCFVDSKADAELYRKHFDKICKAIADAIR